MLCSQFAVLRLHKTISSWGEGSVFYICHKYSGLRQQLRGAQASAEDCWEERVSYSPWHCMTLVP